jgi:GNAT-family acetyltransferase (TIGR03103 family)
MAEEIDSEVVVDMGWGRLIFGQTFPSPKTLVDTLLQERPMERDIALYLRDPHVAISYAPQEVFLDPSHTYRLWAHAYTPRDSEPRSFVVRRLRDRVDADRINYIYASRRMAIADPDVILSEKASRTLTFFVAESTVDGTIVGTVTGVDHVEAFSDPEHGASLWCLAVHPQVSVPGLGEALVRHLVEHYFARGRDYVDLSVMHDNTEAIRLYEKLGFQRVPVFCIKRKNPINEPLFTPPEYKWNLNPYAEIIVNEALRRGISVDVQDEELSYFTLSHGGRSIACRESLTELASALAFSRCDDKRMTHRILSRAGIRVPAQRQVAGMGDAVAMLEEHDSVVVKPARGEQGAGVSVGVDAREALERAVERARLICPDVIVEECVAGEDLRIIVIGDEVVAAAVRRPPSIVGTGKHTVEQLIRKYSRRREAATGGESSIPIDDETRRCVRTAGYDMDTILDSGTSLTVRKTANVHTGGTIHDVTAELHPQLAQVAVAAATALDIPVVGFDFIVDAVDQSGYVVIEANERPGLANHEPQPTAERFIDLLFPQTKYTDKNTELP